MDKKKYLKNYYQEHKEERKKRDKIYGKNYRVIHKEEIRKKKRKQYLKNQEKMKARSKAYYKDHPECNLKSKIKTLGNLGKIFNLNNKEINYALNSWSKVVKKNNDNICQICNNKANVSHHLFYKSLYPKLCLNVNNGIPLCLNCHYETHGWFR